MSAPTESLYRVAQVPEIDRRASQALGDSYALMTRAGEAAFRRLAANWPQARRLVVCCGSGNNGGDGYVVARLAKFAGRDVIVIASAPPATDDAKRARRDAEAAGVIVQAFDIALPPADLIVDALLGIGLTEAPRGVIATMIDAIGAHDVPVLALDVPSGLDADCGHAPGACVRATATVCFIVWKRGLFTGDAPTRCGTRWLESLDVEASAFDGFDDRVLRADEALIRTQLARRPRDAHKGHYGHVLVIGGDHGYAGAARLTAEAAARSGAGLVSIATREAHLVAMLAGVPEAMTRGVDDTSALAPLLDRASVIAIGPGLGTSAWSRELLERALASGRPLVVDADALNLVAQSRAKLPPGCVITPHPGEASRLLACDTTAVQRDRFAAATALARTFDCVALLKGAGTVIADAHDRLALSTSGNPGMASGGMGDVLTGIVAALLAQHLSPFDAALVGAYAHGIAADRVAAEQGERGLLARDLIGALPRVLNP
jgi:hydroxyethylthiazole kinase-like uncharacterized protein yjeF